MPSKRITALTTPSTRTILGQPTCRACFWRSWAAFQRDAIGRVRQPRSQYLTRKPKGSQRNTGSTILARSQPHPCGTTRTTPAVVDAAKSVPSAWATSHSAAPALSTPGRDPMAQSTNGRPVKQRWQVMATDRARCPQWYRVFSIQGSSSTYEVYSDDVLAGTWRCSCRAFEYCPPPKSCKHILCVTEHGCLAAPGSAAGRNDLQRVRVTVTDAPYPAERARERTRRSCTCGELMVAPVLRLRDACGCQIVEVQFSSRGARYAYAWRGRELAVGDIVPVARPSGWQPDWPRPDLVEATVVALGTDWTGELTTLSE